MSNQYSNPAAPNFLVKSRWFTIMLVVFLCAAPVSFAQSKNQYGSAGSTKMTEINDAELLGWAGKWQGHCHVDADSIPIEIKWKLADDGQWMRGEFKIWTDFKKATLLHNEIIFIRPAETFGTYKGIAIGDDGNCRMGQAKITNREWDWTWSYDNGNQEKGKLLFFGQGEIMYDATVVDAGGTVVKTLNYDITRPSVSQQSKY
jgi:hypothetical protein